jgi:hypothetical protein
VGTIYGTTFDDGWTRPTAAGGINPAAGTLFGRTYAYEQFGSFVPGDIPGLILFLRSDAGITPVLSNVVATGTSPPAVTFSGLPSPLLPVEVDVTGTGALGVPFTWKLGGVVQGSGITAANVPLGLGTLAAQFPVGAYTNNDVYKANVQASAWADQSGAGNNAVQATSSHQLVFNLTGANNNQPYLSNPSGLGTNLMTGTFAIAPTNVTLFVVAAYVSNAAQQTPFCTNDINVGSAFFYKNPGMCARVDATTLIDTPNTESALDAAFHVHVLTANSSFITYYRDGLQRTQIAGNGAPVSQTAFTIGQFGTSTSFPWPGGISGILAYNSALSPAQVALVSAYALNM